jgi:hypothetical protein
MMRKVHLAAALAVCLVSGSTLAQYDIPISKGATTRELPDPKPVYKYELKPEHGEFMVVVRTFRGPVAADEKGVAKELAEGLAEYIRSECRLYAYVHESGWALRQERKVQKAMADKAARDYYRKEGLTEKEIEDRIRREIKIGRAPDEYSVLVLPGKGTLKTMDEAIEFAKYVRKLKAPPAEFCDSVAVGSSQEISQRRGELQNPFLMAMPGRNPTMPKKVAAAERPRADEFLMSLNAGKPDSLIHNTKKDFTLVVQVYGSKQIGRVIKPGEVTQTSSRTDGEMLERAAQQAHQVAKFLRQQKPPYDAYVLHTRYESFVCVGEYDSKDDPQLLANAKALAALPLKDQKTGQVIDTFMEKPLPAMIPRP